MTKKYLITGGAGFIGANFVKYLQQTEPESEIIILDALTYAVNSLTFPLHLENEKTTLIKADLRDRAKIFEIMEKVNPDIIVNFAAESHVDRSIRYPDLVIESNINGTQNLMDAARQVWAEPGSKLTNPVYRHGVRFHQISTDEVFGHLEDNGYFTEETKLAPRSPYSASKAAAELLTMAYYTTFKLPISITNCSNNYGPFQHAEKLIPLSIKKILNGEKIPVYGDGLQERDWLHVIDHCRGVKLCIDKGENGSRYCIGGNNSIKNIELINILIDEVHKTLEEKPEFKKQLKKPLLSKGEQIEYVNDRPGHDKRYAINQAKIEQELGFHLTYTHEQGLRETVRWYIENQDWLEKSTSPDLTY